MDEVSCNKEEEYQPISIGEEESKESTEAPNIERGYDTLTAPRTSSKVRYRDLSTSGFVNTSSTNAVNSGKWSPTSQNHVLTVPAVNTMVGTNIKFPIFNGNGLKDLEQHWFLCEVVWTVRQIQDENIKKTQMITILQVRALN